MGTCGVKTARKSTQKSEQVGADIGGISKKIFEWPWECLSLIRLHDHSRLAQGFLQSVEV